MKAPKLTPQQKAQILGDEKSALKTHIVCFSSDGESTVRIEARNSIEAAGQAYQSKAAQMVLKGKWPLRCRVIAVASLPRA